MPNTLDLKMAEIWSSPVCPGAIQVEAEHLELPCGAAIVNILTECKTSLLASIHSFCMHTERCTKLVLLSLFGKLSFSGKVLSAGGNFFVMVYQPKLFGN